MTSCNTYASGCEMTNTLHTDFAVLTDIKDATYRGATGLSQSSLKLFLTSPAHYLASLDAIVEPSKAMQFGTAFHANLLQPNPSDHYAVKQKVDGRSKEGKAYNEQFQLENEGKVIIDTEDEARIASMKLSVMSHITANSLMNNLTHSEFAVFGTYKANAGTVRVKGLIDGYCEKTGIIVDIKTCEDASPRGFRKAIWDRRYDIQVVQYCWLLENAGLPVTDFVFVAVEKMPPFAVGCYTINPESLKNTKETWTQALERYAVCQLTGRYPAYSDFIEHIIL